MEYKFSFNKQDCWYRQVCPSYNKSNCNENCVRYGYLHYLAEHALLSYAQQHPMKLKTNILDSDAYDKLNDIKSNIVSFVQSGKNLMINSKNTGNGKTTWASKLIMQYLATFGYCESPKALFINVPKFCMMKKDMIAGYTHPDLHYILSQIETVDLVIWDDLVATEITPYDYLTLYVYINSRMDKNKSNIYTSNYVGEQVKKTIGDRLYSRVMQGSEIITFKSPDLRETVEE